VNGVTGIPLGELPETETESALIVTLPPAPEAKASLLLVI
jgi:hypothetical protein